MNPKIGCLMWYNSAISKYADINYAINQAYCKKHGYDLIRSSKAVYTDGRTLHWEKIPMMLLYLDKYDYIVWIDADAHFYLDAACLENVINAHPNVSLIFSGDLNQNKLWEINCGFMIVKSDTVSRRLLTMWAYDTMIKTKNTFPYWEQGVLWYMYSLNLGSIRAHSVIIPYGLLQHFYEHELVTFGHNKYTLTKKPFIHHNPGTFALDRYKSSKAYFDLHFAENIGKN